MVRSFLVLDAYRRCCCLCCCLFVVVSLPSVAAATPQFNFSEAFAGTLAASGAASNNSFSLTNFEAGLGYDLGGPDWEEQFAIIDVTLYSMKTVTFTVAAATLSRLQNLTNDILALSPAQLSSIGVVSITVASVGGASPPQMWVLVMIGVGLGIALTVVVLVERQVRVLRARRKVRQFALRAQGDGLTSAMLSDD